jgi:hypothetical protein
LRKLAYSVAIVLSFAAAKFNTVKHQLVLRIPVLGSLASSLSNNAAPDSNRATQPNVESSSNNSAHNAGENRDWRKELPFSNTLMFTLAE